MLLLGLASIATSLSPPPNLANCDLTQADVDAAWKAGYEVGKSGGPAPWGPSSPPGPPPGPPPTYEEDATITNADYPKRWYHNEADVQEACNSDAECKGYWQRTVSGSTLYAILTAGSRTFSAGVPNWTVRAVYAKTNGSTTPPSPSPPPPSPPPPPPPPPPPSPSPSPPPSPTPCTYTLVSDSLSWSDADAACQAAGLQLATVQSAEQNALLLTVVGDNEVWIGGTDAASEGAWVWSPSNASLSYTNWGFGEPNDYNNGEDCLMFNWRRGRSRPPYTAGQWTDMPCANHAKYVCQTACPVPPPSPPATTPAPPPVATPEYQKLNRLDPGCPEEFEITTLEACRLAITSLVGTAFDQWPPYFSPGREGQPRGCSLSNWGMGGKKGQTLVWNEVAVGRGRHDLAPVCKWTGTPTPPEPAPAPVPDDRDNVTVTPEEWDYFLAFQESRARGFSCRCNSGTGGTDQCNEIEGASKHFYAPNPEKVTFDCKLWKAAYWHSEDQAIQGYCSHTARDPDGLSPRMRAGRVGAVGPWEHIACAGSRHPDGPGALRGLQSSPSHCNSMYDLRFKGFAVGHSSPSTGRDVWTAMYNRGGNDISDSESCIPEGYTATGDRK